MLNPIMRRELTVLLRQRQALLLQCGLVIALSFLVVLRWPTDSRAALSGTRAQEVFAVFAYGLLSAMVLFLPAIPATSIVREKNQGTLALLLNTRLSSWRIFFGKLSASTALAGILCALSLPAVTACYALGGVSLTKHILPMYGLVALTAVEYSTAGLLVSTLTASPAAAVRATYALVLCLSVFSFVPHYFFIGTEGLPGECVQWLRSVSPFAAMSSLLGAGDLGGHGLISTTPVPVRFAGLSVLLTGACSLWTIRRLNHTLFDRARSSGVMADDQDRSVQRKRRLWFLVDPQRRSRAIGPWMNPVMVKEFRCRRFGRLSWLLRLVAACAVLSLGLAILTTTRTVDWDAATIGAIMVVLQVGLLVFITPSLTAGLFSAERESGGWVLLQMTRMSAWQIVWGKLLSVLLTLMLVLCATLPGYVVMVFIEPGQKLEIQRVVTCLIGTALFAMLVTAAVSSLFRRTTAATAAGYAALLAVCAGPLLVWLGRDAPFGHDVVEAALTINPAAAAFSVIRLAGFRDYRLIPANWWFLAAVSVVSLILLAVQVHRISKPQ